MCSSVARQVRSMVVVVHRQSLMELHIADLVACIPPVMWDYSLGEVRRIHPLSSFRLSDVVVSSGQPLPHRYPPHVGTPRLRPRRGRSTSAVCWGQSCGADLHSSAMPFKPGVLPSIGCSLRSSAGLSVQFSTHPCASPLSPLRFAVRRQEGALFRLLKSIFQCSSVHLMGDII